MREESKVPHGEAIAELAGWVRHNTVLERLEAAKQDEQQCARLAAELHDLCATDGTLKYLLRGLSRDPVAQRSALREAIRLVNTLDAARSRVAAADEATASGWSEREQFLLRS